MSVRISDLDVEVKDTIKESIKALFHAADRMQYALDEDDYQVKNTVHDIKELCTKYL